MAYIFWYNQTPTYLSIQSQIKVSGKSTESDNKNYFPDTSISELYKDNTFDSLVSSFSSQAFLNCSPPNCPLYYVSNATMKFKEIQYLDSTSSIAIVVGITQKKPYYTTYPYDTNIRYCVSNHPDNNSYVFVDYETLTQIINISSEFVICVGLNLENPKDVNSLNPNVSVSDVLGGLAPIYIDEQTQVSTNYYTPINTQLGFTNNSYWLIIFIFIIFIILIIIIAIVYIKPNYIEKYI